MAWRRFDIKVYAMCVLSGQQGVELGGKVRKRALYLVLVVSYNGHRVSDHLIHPKLQFIECSFITSTTYHR